MQIDILRQLEIRKKHPIGSRTRNPDQRDYISSQINKNPDNLGLILPAFFLNNSRSTIADLKNKLFSNYFLQGMFDLGQIWQPYASPRFTLYIFAKTQSQKISLSIYKGKSTFESGAQHRSQKGAVGPQLISEEFHKYIQFLEQKVRKIEANLSNVLAVAWEIDYEELQLEYLNIEYYQPAFSASDDRLKKEKTKPLKSLVKLIRPKPIKNQEGLSLRLPDFKYPIDYSKLKKGKLTDVVLQKGDIVLGRTGLKHIYLINENPRKELSPSPHSNVLRIESAIISPKYLFLYLKSDTFKKYFIRRASGATFPHLRLKDIGAFPVILPDLETQQRSESLFSSLYLTQKEDDIDIINRELFAETIPKKPFQKELLNELLTNLSARKLNLIAKIMKEDLIEIQKCLSAKAYKSATVLCGSILEALLLNWLSDIHKKDYFNSVENPTSYEIIKELEKRKLLNKDQLTAAHDIRLQRNLIHPKKYLSQHKSIDGKSSTKMLKSLQKVVSAYL